MRAWVLGLVSMLLALTVGCTENRYLTTFTAANYNAAFPPVTSTRIINVGNANPVDIYKRDFPKAVIVGSSDWVGNEALGDSCKGAAKKLGADLVLWSKVPNSSGEVTTSMTVPTQQTTYSSGNIYGSQGSYGYVGSSTTYGTRSVPVSMYVVWYEFRTVYLRTKDAKSVGNGE